MGDGIPVQFRPRSEAPNDFLERFAGWREREFLNLLGEEGEERAVGPCGQAGVGENEQQRDEVK